MRVDTGSRATVERRSLEGNRTTYGVGRDSRHQLEGIDALVSLQDSKEAHSEDRLQIHNV